MLAPSKSRFNGIIYEVNTDKQFGYIRETGGTKFFFHARYLRDQQPLTLDLVGKSAEFSFDSKPVRRGESLRAVDVQVL